MRKALIPCTTMAWSALLFSTIPALADGLPRIAKSTPYAQARKALLGAGYKPGSPEQVGCAGTGLGQCIYAWQKGGKRIEVVTVGEKPKIVSLVRPAQ